MSTLTTAQQGFLADHVKRIVKTTPRSWKYPLKVAIDRDTNMPMYNTLMKSESLLVHTLVELYTT